MHGAGTIKIDGNRGPANTSDSTTDEGVGLNTYPTKSTENQPASSPRTGWENSRWAVPVLLGLIVTITVIAYSPVLFNFFAGDDFVHLTWLKQALQQPELIWRNFHSSWLDGTTTKFYRPLISIFMVTDYLIGRTNGLVFHITNLIFHTTSAVLIFFVVRRLASLTQVTRIVGVGSASTIPGAGAADTSQVSPTQLDGPCVWALTAAAIFALYPLHPEAVSWITGRVDTIVTTFCLASLWCYMQWRHTGSVEQLDGVDSVVPTTIGTGGRAGDRGSESSSSAKWFWLVAAAVTFILGLLSKEMAITTPALFVGYELFGTSGISLSRRWIVGAFKRSLYTLPFWALLAGYFVVRRLALGTFVGGYDDSLFFIADPKSFALNWLHGLRMLLVPLNREMLNGKHPLTNIWLIALAVGAVMGINRLWRGRHLQAVGFYVMWLGLALAPVYKLFAIADDLQGSRLAYLATVPVSILLAYCFTGAEDLKVSRLRIPAWLAPSAMAGLCAVVLFINNQPWRLAGLEANAIRQGLDHIYSATKGDPQTMFIGLPDQIDGSYVCRNAVFGMSKSPQISRDINNDVMVNEFEPVLPFGYLKESMSENRSAIKVYRWDTQQKTFIPITIPPAGGGEDKVFSGAAISGLPDFGTFNGTNILAHRDADSFTVSNANKRNRPEIGFALPAATNSWNVDFLCVKVHTQESGAKGVGADLLFANDGHPQFKLASRTHAELEENKVGVDESELVFALRSLAEWALGGHHARFRLMLPPGSIVTVKSIAVVPAHRLMPQMNFANSGYLGTKGYLHLGHDHLRDLLSVDSSGVLGAASTLLEVTRPNFFFEQQNCKSLSNVGGRLIPAPLKGSVTLSQQDFPVQGIYELRAWAVDRSGRRLGVASDHIAISTD